MIYEAYAWQPGAGLFGFGYVQGWVLSLSLCLSLSLSHSLRLGGAYIEQS